jgi:acyl-CoA synthetase (NDP forming)/GNAT superfamily N-acetyltransferase
MSVVGAGAHEVPTPKYPSAWEFDGLLTDGTAVCVRPIRPSDVALLVSFHTRLSPETITRGYLGAHAELSSDEASYYTDVDYRDRMGFVVVVSEQLVGFASYARIQSKQVAEIAFVVADELRRHGVATLLFESLAAYARTVGIVRFVADVLTDNLDMLEVFGATGLGYERVAEGDTVRIKIDLQPTPEYVARCDARESSAEAASVAMFMRPRSIAVVGAGRHPDNAGHQIVRSLLAGDFAGTVYPVNPHAHSIAGAPAFPSLFSLPEPIDLAIIAVPPDVVRDIVGQAATIGVRSAVIITAGFGETGSAGAEIEAEMLSVARHHGMRIVGPNCLGLVNTDPAVQMDATFAELASRPGRLALVSQSGALGVALAHEARRRRLGLSTFASIGNKLDVTSNDLLCFLEHDARTSVIALYLESFGNPRKFARIARRVGADKPIVALTAGRTSSGSRAAQSHTAAAATPDVMVTALLEGAGVIKVDHLDELLDVSSVLLTGMLPAGGRVALVGNSGGPLILAADASEECGLSVPRFGATTRIALEAVVAASAAVANPVDLTADGGALDLERALVIVDRDDEIDATIVVVTDLPALSATDARAAVARHARSATKPVLACVLGSGEKLDRSDDPAVAELPSPERAAAALAHVARYAMWRQRPRTAPAAEPVRAVVVNDAVVAALERHPEGGWLDLDEAAGLLDACGLPLLSTRAATSAAEATEVAAELGLPVVLKARSGELVHKSEAGGVVVGIESPIAAGQAFDAMAARLGSRMGGAVLQPMAPPGVEAIVGVVSDPLFGPVVMVGLGGVTTDLLGDHAFAIPPLDPGRATAMVASLRAAPLLEGYRGSAPVDRAGLIRLIELVAHIADEVPELAELDCNPVLVGTDSVMIVDCKARLSQAHLGPNPLFRALRARR